jgi:hypothetical protein
MIGRQGRISFGSGRMAMEKHKVVIGECEMSAEAHGMGATERDCPRCGKMILGMPKSKMKQKGQPAPLPSSRSKTIEPLSYRAVIDSKTGEFDPAIPRSKKGLGE